MTPDAAFRLVAGDVVCSVDPVELARRAGFVLDSWQAAFARSRSSRLFVLAPRQHGKGLASAVAVLHAALYRPPVEAVVVSKSLNQSKEWLKRLKTLRLPTAGLFPVEAETQSMVTWANGSRALSVPSGAAARGFTADVLVLDEAAFIADDDVAAVLPVVKATAGRILVLTTPSPGRSWARSVWEDGGPEWERIAVRPEESPRLFDPEAAEKERELLGESRYRREHRAEWADDVDPRNPLVFPQGFFDRPVAENDAPEARRP